MVAAPQRHSVELQAQEIDKRLRADLRNNGESSRVHALPRSSQERARRYQRARTEDHRKAGAGSRPKSHRRGVIGI